MLILFFVCNSYAETIDGDLFNPHCQYNSDETRVREIDLGMFLLKWFSESM